ncbi:MAG: glutaredoxin family protein [Deltaproteobacteria bacterium]|nr:glutaredoxin family protein [Deltaproteobacteria bacterium]
MFCDEGKAWLSRRGFSFTERDITTDSSALADLRRMKVFTTPVYVIGNDIVVGFDQRQLELLLSDND